VSVDWLFAEVPLGFLGLMEPSAPGPPVAYTAHPGVAGPEDVISIVWPGGSL
jgi:hypothetical protein